MAVVRPRRKLSSTCAYNRTCESKDSARHICGRHGYLCSDGRCAQFKESANDLIDRMAAFIELKNQVDELTDEVKASKSILCELRDEFVDVKSEMCAVATQLKSIKSATTSAWSIDSSDSMVGFSATTTGFPQSPRPAGRAEKIASTGVEPTRSNGDSSNGNVQLRNDFRTYHERRNSKTATRQRTILCGKKTPMVVVEGHLNYK